MSKGAKQLGPLITALHDKNRKVRQNAAEALGRLGDKQAVEPLIFALNDRSKYVREQVMRALGKLGDKRACEPLITVLKEGKSRAEQSMAALALGQIGDNRAVEPLLVAFQDKDLRWNAGYALGHIGDSRAIEPLIKGLEDEFPSHGVRFGLVELGELALEPLVGMLWDGSSIARRNAADVIRQFWFHGKSADLIIKSVIEPLVQLLRDKDDVTRAYAVIVLCDIRDRRSFEPLLELVKDESAYVRWCLAGSLRNFDDARAIPALEWIQQNDNGSQLVGYEDGSRREMNRDVAAHSIEYLKRQRLT